MLEAFSIQAVKIIDEAKILAAELNSNVIGSEHLLLSMYKTKDSICRFLLEEKNITYEDIYNTLNNLTIIHKNESEKLVFTDKFHQIIINSEKLANRLGNKYVYDEHIFYSLLEDGSSVATEMLIDLNLDLDNLMLDIEDIYNFKLEVSNSPYPFLVNLTEKKEVHPYIDRGNFIERINYILDKKQKNNPLLIGSAGVGKTAIIEGLSKIRTKDVIYQLDLGGCVAGTKYRGELEEKLIKVIDFIKETKSILFIDEIHNVVGAGSNEGSLDIANILKPYLSKDICVIGATTLEEYYKFIEKDKALMRRFQTIFIDEPNIEETKMIINGIKDKYEEYHNFTLDDDIIDTILNKTDIYLPNKTFPDKAIDVIDELGSRYHYDNREITDIINKIIFDLCNINIIDEDSLNNMTLNYDKLKNHYLDFIHGKKHHNMLVTYVNDEFILEDLIVDLYKIFNFKKEMLLEINLDYYNDSTMLSNLIGSSKGYVGYEQGGILSEHIIKYPLCLIYFKNYDKCNYQIKCFIDRLINDSFLVDNKSRKINLRNCIFVIDKKQQENKIGFNQYMIEDKYIYLSK